LSGFSVCARGGVRTRTPFGREILSLLRLPVPSPALGCLCFLFLGVLLFCCFRFRERGLVMMGGKGMKGMPGKGGVVKKAVKKKAVKKVAGKKKMGGGY